MIGRKRLLRVIAVLSVAIATGQTVENMRPSPTALNAAAAGTGGYGALTDNLPSSASLYSGAGRPLPDLMGITPVAAASEGRSADGCAPSLALKAAEGAMITLSLEAPCNVGERVVIRHSGISFTALMGLDGHLSLILPALEREALVAAYFEGSSIALASVSVPDAVDRARFAFQAPYPLQFELRAEEGDTIHVGGPSIPGRASTGRIMTLGSKAVAQPLIAQVYTFSGSDLAASQLSVEVRITDQSCSRSFLAETRTSHGGNIIARTLPIAVPICGTAGDILVLKNLVPDTTLVLPK